ncbi:MAG: HIT domain-containing protein [Ornithinimicrobium sp.]
MADCIFCSIVSGDVDATVVAESDTALAFRDQSPAAPVHVLVIPREHHESAAEMALVDAQGLADLFTLVGDVARSEEVQGTGYRVLTNVGGDAGQEVAHLHLHVVGGGPLGALLGPRRG